MLMKSKSPAPCLELRVLTGRQAGARARLEAHDDLLLCGQGGSDAGDTQFADILLSSDVGFQARLIPSAHGRVSVQLIGGQAVLDKHELTPGTTVHAWAPGQPLHLGDNVVAYGPADAEHWPEPVMHDELEGLAQDAPAARPQAPVAPSPHRSAMVEAVLAALGIFMVASGGMLAWRGGVLRDAGQAVANVVPPAQAASPGKARDPAELLASAVDVFRLNGIAAQANWSPEGELVMHTRERDIAKAQAAAAAARRDIARLPALRLDNQQPAVAAAPTAAADDPAKRLVAVVDNTDSPYFITADGSRYFSGALLPSGHRVVEIAERAVVVERDGQRTRMTL